MQILGTILSLATACGIPLLFFFLLVNPVDINVRIVTDGERYGVRKFGIPCTMLDLDVKYSCHWLKGFERRRSCWGTKEQAIEAYKFFKREKHIKDVDVKDLEGE